MSNTQPTAPDQLCIVIADTPLPPSFVGATVLTVRKVPAGTLVKAGGPDTSQYEGFRTPQEGWFCTLESTVPPYPAGEKVGFYTAHLMRIDGHRPEPAELLETMPSLLRQPLPPIKL